MNSINKFCIILLNGRSCFGRYTFQILTFQYKYYLFILTGLLPSLQIFKASNDLQNLKDNITLLLNKLIVFTKLENSKVYELTYIDESYYKEIVDDKDANKFKLVKLLLQTYTPQCENTSNGHYIFDVIFEFFIERASLLQFFYFVKIIVLIWIGPVMLINKSQEYFIKNSRMKNKKIEEAYSILIDMVDYPYITEIAADVIIASINHYDKYGDTKAVSLNDLTNVPAFNNLLKDFQDRFEALVLKDAIMSQRFFENKDNQHEYFMELLNKIFFDQSIPDIIKLLIIELMSNEMNNDQTLYDIHCRHNHISRLLENLFLENSCSVCAI